jgi:PAS domain S-box-containing protein
VIILLAATNDFHNLIWTGSEPGLPGTNSPFYLHGTAYRAAIVYVFTCCSLATALLIFSVTGSQDIYRKQSRYFLAASLFPWLGAALYILDINPFPGLDTISISLFFTGLLLLFALHRKQLMDMVPISHELIIEHIDDAVLVIDQKHCMMDTNAAADSLLGLNKKDDLGKPAGDIPEFWEAVASDILEEKSSRHEITLRDADKTLDVKNYPHKDRGARFIGWGLILSDVTNMKEIEKSCRKPMFA